MKRRWVRWGLVVLAVAAVGAFGYYEALKRAWIRYNQYDVRSEGSLEVGDLAPDLELEAVDGGGPKKISDFYGTKPLVLIFGSYT